MLGGFGNIQKATVTATLVALAILTIWGSWTVIHMNDGRDLLSHQRI